MKFLVTTLLLFSALYSAALTTSNCHVTQDTYVISSTTNNYNSTGDLFAGRNGTSYYSRTYIQFDLSQIPQDAIIVSAKLKLRRIRGTVGNSSYLYAEYAQGSWDETLLNSSNQPALSVADGVNYSSYSDGWRIFELGSHVQKMVKGSLANNGWCIRYWNESSTVTDNYKFEGQSGTYPPVLEVTFYRPVFVSSAAITHASGNLSTDGAITPSFTNGSGGTYSYTWINASGNTVGTARTLNNVGYGWYGLHATDATNGDDLYMAFLVGVECGTVEIDFNPGANYVDDALLHSLVRSGTDYGTINYGSISYIAAQRWTYTYWYSLKTLLRFRLWMDNDFLIEEADLYLYGNGEHNPLNRSNESNLYRVTASWEEMEVTNNTAPGYSSGDAIYVAGTSSASENKVLDMRSHWNTWKNNNLANYGDLLTLVSDANQYTQMRFYSSDQPNMAVSPQMHFKLTIGNPGTCNYPYARLSRKLDGQNYPVRMDRIFFFYDEQYIPDNGLSFQVKDRSGTVVMDESNIALQRSFGDNRYALEVSSLDPGTYVLEVTNDKNEKLYLRFTRP